MGILGETGHIFANAKLGFMVFSAPLRAIFILTLPAQSLKWPKKLNRVRGFGGITHYSWAGSLLLEVPGRRAHGVEFCSCLGVFMDIGRMPEIDEF